MKQKTVFVTEAAVIAALYAALTYICAVFGIAYAGIQFRLSEMLCVLPLFTPAAVPGLAVGCALANIVSTVNPADIVIGSLATLLSAWLTRKCRFIAAGGYPLLSMLMPVVINAVFIGAELSFFYTSSESRFTVFVTSALSVFIGEAAVVFIPGSVLMRFIRKNAGLRSFLASAELRRQ